MKSALCLLVFFFTLSQAQETYITREGTISFNASTPLEDIQARNAKVNAIYKKEGSRVGIVVLIREFEFPNKLMQEHFNENYLHSDRYPKATFVGRVLYPEEKQDQEATIQGKLTIHGITREVVLPGHFRNSDAGKELTVDFLLKPEDYNIRIPKIVFKKIAEEVRVKASFQLEPE